jgi:hypothetical protein
MAYLGPQYLTQARPSLTLDFKSRIPSSAGLPPQRVRTNCPWTCDGSQYVQIRLRDFLLEPGTESRFSRTTLRREEVVFG